MNKYNIGDKVQLVTEENPREVGIVVNYWFDNDMRCFDYHVAFFGENFPEGKPKEVPYILRYLETSLDVFDAHL